MKGGRLLAVAVTALYLLHNDLWWWDDPTLVLGFPIGLTYHVGFCIVTALVMAMAARRLPRSLPNRPPNEGR